MDNWPKDVGILAIELIFPSQYVDQTELETYDAKTDKDVTPGKYTKGLGQERMGFCSDREDINSLCLTVVQNLIERNDLKYSDIGRLEVGTETIIDKSKSVKSVLMQLFEPHGVTDLEGIDTTNACYGGTAALFNAISWVESSAWNGRYALVVAGDIAVYATGKARPTGGAGAVAMLIGPDAPLVLERGVRSTYMKHAYDFYKPDLTSEYPTVDGPLSVKCYLEALDNCYQQYCKKVTEKTEAESTINLNHLDSVLFHSPYCKLVQKSLARLVLNDYFHLSEEDREKHFAMLQAPEDLTLENSLKDKDFERRLMSFAKPIFQVKTEPSLLIASQVGNMYTPSLYGGLVSLLVSKSAEKLAGNRVGLFSYGSGLAASFYSIKISDEHDEDSKLYKLVDNLKHIKTLLKQRQKIAPEDFVETLELREKVCHKAPYEPVSDIEHFFPGTYYLTKIDEKYRRFYERIPVAANGHA